ncbi:hypothetical protein [Sorangium sp. So ce145]|uniref:hypothetical protein n=1 Tax=Sorangium sp. So ce145 TaxID=3133285 RepID=UPI003F6327B4
MERSFNSEASADPDRLMNGRAVPDVTQPPPVSLGCPPAGASAPCPPGTKSRRQVPLPCGEALRG